MDGSFLELHLHKPTSKMRKKETIFLALLLPLVIAAVAVLIYTSIDKNATQPADLHESTSYGTGTGATAQPPASPFSEITLNSSLTAGQSTSPALTPEEQERYLRLEIGLRTRWKAEENRLTNACTEIGLSQDQTAQILSLFSACNAEFLNLSSRMPDNNKEFEKARSRLYRKFRDECSKYLDRPIYQKLADKAPDIFDEKK